MRGSIVLSAACLLALSACVDNSDTQTQPADKVLTNGRIYTVDSDQPWADSVAIRDGVYVYVGDAAGVDLFVGEDTQVVDLQRKIGLMCQHVLHRQQHDHEGQQTDNKFM